MRKIAVSRITKRLFGYKRPEYRWTVRSAGNGEVIQASHESFKNKEHAEKNLVEFCSGRIAVYDFETNLLLNPTLSVPKYVYEAAMSLSHDHPVLNGTCPVCNEPVPCRVRLCVDQVIESAWEPSEWPNA